MTAVTLAQACIEIPWDCLNLLTTFVEKIGGHVVLQGKADEVVVVVPPLSERERIGRLLHGARLRAGLTQKALAAAIGVPQSHISEYEKNRRPIPRAKAEELARVLETMPTHFLPKNVA